MNAAGSQVLGELGIGVNTARSGTKVTGNTIFGKVVSVLIATADAEGAEVSTNRVGVAKSSSTLLAGQGRGIRIDGAPRAMVTGNVVAAAPWAEGDIEVIGGVQFYLDDGEYVLNSSRTPSDSPVTGGHATVVDNTVGAGVLGSAHPGAEHGVFVWYDASSVTVSGNTAAGSSAHAIALEGGSDHVVAANRLGSTTAGDDAPVVAGIKLAGVAGATVGSGNMILTDGAGIETFGVSPSTTVEGNTITGPADGTSDGIGLSPEGGGAIISGNGISGFDTGINVSSSNATIFENTLSENVAGIVAGDHSTIADNVVDGGAVGDFGILVAGETPVVERNSVVATSDGAVVVEKPNGTVEANLIGMRVRGGAVTGNDGDGIVVTAGPALVKANVIAGTIGDGIKVGAAARATLESNQIADTTGAPISVAGSMTTAAPVIAAAVTDTSGGSARTTLLISDLPETGTGTIELFANRDCATGEAERVLGVTRDKAEGSTVRLIQLVDRPHADHFTVTYTSEGATSVLSECESIGTFPDADGDGSPEPFDNLLGDGDDDPTTAVVVTDNEELLGVSLISRGDDDVSRLTRVAAVDDPAPGAHPDGFELAYGAISFWIEGLEIGGSANVDVVQIDGDTGTIGDTYWKFAPPTPGAAPEWFDFGSADVDAPGASRTVRDIPGVGLRRTWTLRLTDGQRGDNSGPDGIIVDPGGPGFGHGSPVDPTDPVDPNTPVEPTSPVDPASPVDPGSPTGPGMPSAQDDQAAPGTSGQSGSPGGVQSTTSATLPRTGANTWALVLWGLALCLVGFRLLVGTRRRGTG